MPENRNSATPQRARRPGQRLSKAERTAAQEKFLKVFANNANVRAACMAAGIDRSTIYRWQEHDTVFSIRFKQAELEANDLIRAALWRRGVEGVEKHVVSMGKVVYGPDGKPLLEREYSDNLLSLLAKARMPEFRDKQSLDVHNHANPQDVKALHDAIADALAPYPEARVAVAAALAAKGK